MFFEKKKKKDYSEVSDTKKIINSDYFNMFQSEFKKMFSDKNSDKNLEINKNLETNNQFNTNNKVKNKINIEIDDNDIFFINLFSKYMKNK